MGFDRGRNAGITGLVDIAGTPKFTARIYQWKEHIESGSRDRSGRGDDVWGTSAPTLSTGNIALSGKVQLAGWPLPDTFKGQTGTITVQLHTGVTQTINVRITGADFSIDEESSKIAPGEAFWDVSFTAQILSNPALIGFTGTQPTATVPAGSTKQTWSGLGKTVDPKSLQDGATQRFDITGLSDDDGSEVSKISSTIAAAIDPVGGLKLRPAGFERIAPDSGIITLQWQRRNTADDVTMPATHTTVDPSGLQSSAAIAAINGVPGVPAGDAFVKTQSTTSPIHDTATLQVDEYALRSNHQAVEMDGTQTKTDPLELTDSATITKETTSGTPPAAPALTGFVYRTVTSQQLNPNHWKHTFEYGTRTTAEDVTMPGTENRIDPSDLESAGRQTLVYATGGSVPAATVPTGLQTTTTGTQLLDDVNSKVEYEFAKDSTKQKVQQENTQTTLDPQGLQSVAAAALVDATPTTPSGFVARETMTRQVTHDHALNVLHAGLRTTQDDIEMPGTSITTDPKAIKSEGRQTSVYTTSGGLPVDPTPPTGQQIVDSATQQLNQTKSQKQWRFAVNNSQQEVEFSHTHAATDVQDLKSESLAASVFANGTPPSIPIAPTGTKIIDYTDIPVTPVLSVRVWRYGKDDNKDAVVHADTNNEVDPLGLTTRSRTSAVDATPIIPSGQVARGTTTRTLVNGHVENVIEGGLRSTQDDVEMPHERTAIDQWLLQSEQIFASVFAPGSPPADPTTPTNLKLDKKWDTPLLPTKSLRVWEFRATDSKDRATFPDTWTATDPQGLESKARAAGLNTTPTLPAGFKQRSTTTKALDANNTLNVIEGGLRDTKGDIELPGTFTEVDPTLLSGSGRVTKVWSGSAPVVTPPPNLKIVRTNTEAINDLLSKTVTEFDLMDNADKALVSGSRGQYGSMDRGYATIPYIQNVAGASMPEVAQLWHNTYKSAVDYEGVDVRLLTPDKALVIVKAKQPSTVVTADMEGGQKHVRLRHDKMVFLNQVVTRDATRTFIQIRAMPMWHSRMIFHISKIISVPDAIPMHQELTNTKNQAVFLGLPAGYCTYIGAKVKTNLADAAPRVAEISYGFMYDSLGIMDDSQIPIGWTLIVGSISISGRGWKLATDAGLTAPDVPDGDYSVFL